MIYNRSMHQQSSYKKYRYCSVEEPRKGQQKIVAKHDWTNGNDNVIYGYTPCKYFDCAPPQTCLVPSCNPYTVVRPLLLISVFGIEFLVQSVKEKGERGSEGSVASKGASTCDDSCETGKGVHRRRHVNIIFHRFPPFCLTALSVDQTTLHPRNLSLPFQW